jgi:hypothetical protein
MLVVRPEECIECYFLLCTEKAFDDAYAHLCKRYGNTFTLASAFRNKLGEWPKIVPSDTEFVDFLRQCKAAMITIPSLSILNDEFENRKILDKLPTWLVKRWSRIVSQTRNDLHRFPSFSEFVDFMGKEEDIVRSKTGWANSCTVKSH